MLSRNSLILEVTESIVVIDVAILREMVAILSDIVLTFSPIFEIAVVEDAISLLILEISVEEASILVATSLMEVVAFSTPSIADSIDALNCSILLPISSVLVSIFENWFWSSFNSCITPSNFWIDDLIPSVLRLIPSTIV